MATAASSLCCSIEMEPRTLSESQLNQARVSPGLIQETAGGIAKKLQPREAEFIFTEGLRSIHSIKETRIDEMMNENNKSEKDLMSVINPKARIMEKPCQCALADALQEPSSTHDQAMNEPHTAPF